MSSLVPSVVVTSAWVSPRVKTALTVSAGENSGFDPNFADLVEGASIGTALLIDHLIAENALPESLEVCLELGFAGGVVFRQRSQLALS